MKTKAILCTNVNEVRVEQVEIPEPADHELLIETQYSCISPGTELRCVAGQQPNSVPYPFIPGYTMVGTVIAAGKNTSLPIGTKVQCSGTTRVIKAERMWGGHVAHAVQPEANVFPLPSSLDLIEASMIKLAAIAYRGLRESQPMPHENVAVIGLGPIGMLSARLHYLTGAHVVAADLSPERTLLAERVGISTVTPKPQEGLKAAFQRVFPHGADIVVDATGFPTVLRQAIDLAKEVGWDDNLNRGARIIIQGSYPETFTIPYQEAFLKCATFFLPRDQQPRDIRAVIDLLVRRKFEMRDLISAVRPPEAAPEVYTELRENKGGFMTAVFQWSSET